MKVLKRNGKLEEISFDKILKRIKNLSKGLSVDVGLVAQKTMAHLHDGIETFTIDEKASIVAQGLVVIHPDYSLLAGRIFLSNKEKELGQISYKKRVEGLVPTNIDLTNIDYCEKLFYENQYTFFGAKTFFKTYSLSNKKGEAVELPHELYCRVANFVGKNEYEDFSKDLMQGLLERRISLATPILLRGGTNRPSMISCSLHQFKGDSLEEIMDTYKELSRHSADASGIGVYAGNIRSAYSKINTTNGYACGIPSIMRTCNALALEYNQAGKRKGSWAIYVDIYHRDIYDVIEAKNPTLMDSGTRDIFLGLMIPDNFMRAVVNNEDYYLFCPNNILKAGLKPLYTLWGEEFEAEYNKAVDLGLGYKISALDLMKKIEGMNAKSGLPYKMLKDNINRTSNHKIYGTITNSNLCVSGDTQILTQNGYIKIGENENKYVDVWNGTEWSNTQIIKTGENQELLEISFSNGQTLKCTPYHKFYIQYGYKNGTGANKLNVVVKEAKDLEINDKLIKLTTQCINFDKTDESPYTQGFFSGDGCRYKEKNHIDLYGEKISLLKHLDFTNIYPISKSQNKQRIIINKNFEKFYVPHNTSISNRILWLAGLCDSDGTIAKNGKTKSIQIGSIELDFLKEIHLMLQTLGVQSKITNLHKEGYRNLPNQKGSNSLYYCKKSYRLLIGAEAVYSLKLMGFTTNRLNIDNIQPDRNSEHFVKVIDNVKLDIKEDTYCVHEPLQNKVVFNGILCSNCIEIVQYTDKDTTANCCLGSIIVSNFIKDNQFDFDLLKKEVRLITKALNNVIDKNTYSTLPALNGSKQRAIGIGVLGLADLFFGLDLPYTSLEAKKLNTQITEVIYFAALQESCNIAKTQNKLYDKCDKENFKFHWQYYIEQKDTFLKEEWSELRKDIAKYGLANSLVCAFMPTASCVIKETAIKTSVGDQTYEQILKQNDIDYIEIEKTNEKQWYNLKNTVSVLTRNGKYIECNQIRYNGLEETLKIEMEDGSIFECTKNHKFLVVKNNEHKYIESEHLSILDCIVNINESNLRIKEISANGIKPTWDLYVPVKNHYIMANGCVSHNTSNLQDMYEAFYPQQTNCFTRETMSGEFTIFNKYLIKDLTALGLWNDNLRKYIIEQNGSVAELNISMFNTSNFNEAQIRLFENQLAHIREKYKTAWEMSNKEMIDMAADRQVFIDQSQSFNIWVANPERDLFTIDVYAWKKGLKTMSYYIHTRSKVTMSSNFSVGKNNKLFDINTECIGCGA